MIPLLANLECVDERGERILIDSIENYYRVIGLIAMAGEVIAKEYPDHYVFPTYVVYEDEDEGINYG